ncbi:hypothetical protein R1sor_015995 [Riccia sorocarpa]|uniref:Uroporphyrinogen-III synthase n=1 Tax=Riccia sorocarpa TaxID=122646 RepID=A0ABD3HFL6_9MARC
MATITGAIAVGPRCSGVERERILSLSSRSLLGQNVVNVKFGNKDASVHGGPGICKKKQVSFSTKRTNLAISASAGRSNATVVVTREHGKNGKLMNALSARGIGCLELPLIEHREGADYPKLAHTLREEEFEWVIITSPEAATVFLSGWRAAGCPKVRIAVVGSGTGEVLDEVRDDRINVAFTPSKATAKVLAAELPKQEGGNGEVLYPSSAKAGSDLETGLSERGFKVRRLNTYSTESVKSLDPEKVAAAMACPVATFASPTAVRAWIELVGPWDGAAACIGTTSAKAAKSAGLSRVFCPESPGIDGWVESVVEALDSMCSVQA